MMLHSGMDSKKYRDACPRQEHRACNGRDPASREVLPRPRGAEGWQHTGDRVQDGVKKGDANGKQQFVFGVVSGTGQGISGVNLVGLSPCGR